MSSKDDLRRRIGALLERQSPFERREKSRLIGDKLFGLVSFKNARWVCFYLSLPEEVDTSLMVDRALSLGKRVVLPRCDMSKTELRLYAIQDRATLVKNSYGILEPVPDPSALVEPAEVDLAVVPGVVFDRANHRLGRGRGFYDRFLKKLKAGRTVMPASANALKKLSTSVKRQTVESYVIYRSSGNEAEKPRSIGSGVRAVSDSSIGEMLA